MFERETKNKNLLVGSRLVTNIAKPGLGIEPDYGTHLQRYCAQIQGGHVIRHPVPTIDVKTVKTVKLSSAGMAVFSCVTPLQMLLIIDLHSGQC